MTIQSIKALNYTPDAIEDLKFMERGLRISAPVASYIMRQVIDMLDSSVKFILPNCCDILEPEEYRQAHLDLARLPYPVVTFEIPWVKDSVVPHIKGFPESLSTKRIALCWESKTGFEPIPGCNNVLASYPEGGVFILPISWSDVSEKWMLGTGYVFFPYENTMRKATYDDLLPASKIAMDALRDSGFLKPNARQFNAEPFITCNEFADELIKQAGGRDQLYAQLVIDTRDEIQAFIQACSVLNCENIQTVTLPKKPTKKFVNGRRIEPMPQKDRPAYTYKILQLSDEKTSSEPTKIGAGGGTKRMHLRRGHIRRRNEKLYWIRPTMVNANSDQGFVDKDYSLAVKRKD
ncbi:hypothetical protein ACIPSD_06800 [Pectobacterium sp. CHL-2024]|uniref:hypothetical protein n=1 Tax=Pectobacterium sp. CHL-2024 TaxID=3377079 RepID=UPI0037F34585